MVICFITGDLSQNNWLVALLTFGEGWHNNHHAFKFSARHGMEWWQFDLTYIIIKTLEVHCHALPCQSCIVAELAPCRRV